MPKDPLQLVDLTTARTEFEAEIIMHALESSGIPAKAFSAAGSALQWEIAASQPIRVQVRRCDLEKAHLSLAQTRQESVDFDWSELEAEDIDTVCPACGYSLKGLASQAACPECGRRDHLGGVVSNLKPGDRRTRIWKVVAIALLVLMLLPLAFEAMRMVLHVP